MTVVLTTHYMKDVAALCERVVVITRGDILYDGSLAQIVDRFTTHKIVTLDLDEAPDRGLIERFGFPCEFRGPQVMLRIDRSRIADVLPEILGSAGVRDVSVEDVPLEEIVAELFRADARAAAGRGGGAHERTPDGRPAAPGRSTGLRTWWTMLAICLEERLVYRGDFILGTLMRFLPIVTQVFLWTAVFAATSRADIAGYSRNDIVAYYLLTMVTRAFSSMPGLAGGIARSVRDGSVKKYLVQPVDYVSFLLAARIAHKLVYYAVAAAPLRGRVLRLPRLFPAGPGCRHDRRLHRVARAVVPARLLHGGHARHARLLVPRGVEHHLRLHARAVPALGPHVSARHARRRFPRASRA